MKKIINYSPGTVLVCDGIVMVFEKLSTAYVQLNNFADSYFIDKITKEKVLAKLN